ncbi:MAG: VTT domain-containing protein [Chloroflexi bacterium]|nr:VTT domain-containing protein [Chloroflexota bacterium]
MLEVLAGKAICASGQSPDEADAEPPTAQAASQASRKKLRLSEMLLPFAGTLAGSALVGVAFVYFWDFIQATGKWGYLGVFAAELANSAAIIVPTPGPAYTIGMALVLNPFILGVLGGVAATLGELVGYYIGTRGSSALEGRRFYEKTRYFATRWGGKALFAFAAMPLPFDLAGIWAGTVRYPVWRFLLCVGGGKIVKITAMAVAAAYGLSWLLDPLA